MRVGYVVKRFPRFSETFILNEILELERQGVDVTIFSLLHPSEEKRHEQLGALRAEVIYLPRQRATADWTIQRTDVRNAVGRTVTIDTIGDPLPFAEFFTGKSPAETARLLLQSTTVALLASQLALQHIHAHFTSNPTTVAMLASRFAQLPFSFTAHARDIYHHYVNRLFDDRLRASKMEAAAFVATVSDYNVRHLQSVAPTIDATRIRRLYNGVDLSRFEPDENPSPEPVFAAVGRLVEKKGFSDLVAACRTLKERGYAFRCKIIGDGPLRQDLELQIRECGLGSVVSMPGSLTQCELTSAISGCTAMVLPCVTTASGDRDGLPTVLLEAMAMGLSVVSTETSGVPEIVEHGATGLLVQPGDIDALGGALARLLDDRDEAKRFGELGRLRAEALFDISRNVRQLGRWMHDAVREYKPGEVRVEQQA